MRILAKSILQMEDIGDIIAREPKQIIHSSDLYKILIIFD